MWKKRMWITPTLGLVLPLLLAACGGAATPEEPEPEMPTEVNFAAITSSTVEQPWWTAFAQAFERVKEDPPHGLTMTLDVTENVAQADAERILRQYAETGDYEVIWAHSTYSDAVKVLMGEYPDIAWVFSGSGNEALGGNAYWVDVFIHEPAYLAGIAAGMMTETDVLGAVAAFPFPNVNIPLNAFLDGAQSVNPDVELKVTYIEAWFDPTKAKESAYSQIAAGADLIYAERFGPFEAARERGAMAFGHFLDQTSLAPDVVIGSPMAMWDPNIRNVIEKWWEYTVNGVPYDAPMDRILFSFVEGGSDIAWNAEQWTALPQEVKDNVESAREAILSGELVVELNEDVPETE